MSNFYCSQKFWWLSVDLEKNKNYSCCSATPIKIDFNWIENNPGELFNSPEFINDRKKMLDNIPVESCYNTCWQAESQGLVSRRLSMNSNQQTHSNIKSTPEVLNIIIGRQCNLTCVYCCKQYSSAWAHDIKNNGVYEVNITDDRYTLNHHDLLLLKSNHKEVAHLSTYQRTLNEIKNISNTDTLKTIIITGGEPFLYNDFDKLLDCFQHNQQVEIYTGLGVSESRLEKILRKISQRSNTSLVISAENTKKFYEFSRAGNTWEKFTKNLALINDFKIPYKYNAVLSNTTIFDLDNFVLFTKDHNVTYSLCNDPNFLAINVIDEKSKEYVYRKINCYPDSLKKLIETNLKISTPKEVEQNFKIYIKEFSRRHNLDLKIYPESFTNWINNV